MLDHQQLLTLIDNEKFYSSIISVNVGGKAQPAIIKDVQMHPARNAVVHVDLQRVVENEKIRMHLPIHFKGEAAAPGVKIAGRHRLAPDARMWKSAACRRICRSSSSWICRA